MPKKINVTGCKFGRLRVLGDAERSKSNRRRVKTQCDCGNVTVTDPRLLRKGETKSCGCLQREIVGKSASLRKKFDIPVAKIPEYSVWLGMKKRCYNKNEPKYSQYGERGVVVSERWINCFSSFFSDMGPRPSNKHSLDRIDTNGNYETENCRWATPMQQSHNKRNNILVEYQGKKRPLSEACRLSGVNYRSALWRFHKGYLWMPLPDSPK